MISLLLALLSAPRDYPPPPDCDGLGHGIAHEPAIARQARR